MGIKQINRPPQNWWERFYLFEIVRGLGMTLKHTWLSLTKKGHIPTFQYPEERRPIPDRFRGKHVLYSREDGTPKCVACYCCQTICTPGAIDIVAEDTGNPENPKRPKEFNINMLRCIFCGMCVEACPKEAIGMTKEFELADTTREKLYYTLSDLLEKKKEGER